MEAHADHVKARRIKKEKDGVKKANPACAYIRINNQIATWRRMQRRCISTYVRHGRMAPCAWTLRMIYLDEAEVIKLNCRIERRSPG